MMKYLSVRCHAVINGALTALYRETYLRGWDSGYAQARMDAHAQTFKAHPASGDAR